MRKLLGAALTTVILSSCASSQSVTQITQEEKVQRVHDSQYIVTHPNYEAKASYTVHPLGGFKIRIHYTARDENAIPTKIFYERNFDLQEQPDPEQNAIVLLERSNKDSDSLKELCAHPPSLSEVLRTTECNPEQIKSVLRLVVDTMSSVDQYVKKSEEYREYLRNSN